MKSATEIVVALEQGSGSLCGAVRAGGAPDRPFDGWLALLSALQAAIGETRKDGE